MIPLVQPYILSFGCITSYRHCFRNTEDKLSLEIWFCMPPLKWLSVLDPGLAIHLQMSPSSFDSKGTETNIHSSPKLKIVPNYKLNYFTGRSSITRKQVDSSMSIYIFLMVSIVTKQTGFSICLTTAFSSVLLRVMKQAHSYKDYPKALYD